jgi:hypothetical protein
MESTGNILLNCSAHTVQNEELDPIAPASRAALSTESEELAFDDFLIKVVI